ncbi:hypothetical protein CWM59_20725 [Klebsiella sp. B-Nf7]|nr:hypothetical protein CWM59_20725 [Klebsiella sp. B-Nf7]
MSTPLFSVSVCSSVKIKGRNCGTIGSVALMAKWRQKRGGRTPGPSGVNLCIHMRTGSGPSNSITGTERKPPLLSWSWDILPQNS